MRVTPGERKNTLCSSPQRLGGGGACVEAGPGLNPPPQHHCKNEQLCRLKQHPLVSQNKRRPSPNRLPDALLWQQEGGFFLFWFLCWRSELLQCGIRDVAMRPPHLLPFPTDTHTHTQFPPTSSGRWSTGFSVRSDGGELWDGGEACAGASSVPRASDDSATARGQIYGKYEATRSNFQESEVTRKCWAESEQTLARTHVRAPGASAAVQNVIITNQDNEKMTESDVCGWRLGEVFRGPSQLHH